MIFYGRALADPLDVTGLPDFFERENGVDLIFMQDPGINFFADGAAK